MMEMEFDFGDAPWQRLLASRQPGEQLNAAQLLTFLEEETEEAVEDAFAAIEEKGLLLDITALPCRQYVGQAALRLRQEEQMVQSGMDTRSLSPNDPLRLYLEELESLDTQGDQEALARKAAQGDALAREALTNLGLLRVAELAREYVGYGVLLMDLIQEGSLGLWQAVQGYREGSFAAQRDRAIRESMAKAITIQARNNGVGQKMRQALEDYRAVDQRLLAELGRNPTLEEILEADCPGNGHLPGGGGNRPAESGGCQNGPAGHRGAGTGKSGGGKPGRGGHCLFPDASADSGAVKCAG